MSVINYDGSFVTIHVHVATYNLWTLHLLANGENKLKNCRTLFVTLDFHLLTEICKLVPGVKMEKILQVLWKILYVSFRGLT